MSPEMLSIRVASRLSTKARMALLLVATFAWSGLAHGLNCTCEAATGACIKCCGSETSGFKHCGLNGNGPVPPPAVIYAPYDADKAMPSPVEELPSPAPAAAEAAKKQQEADHKTVDEKEGKEGKKGKVKNPGKSAIPSKTLESTGNAGK